MFLNPREQKDQYLRLYSNPSAVSGLSKLDGGGWQVRPNLHLAYFNSNWKQRWYPESTLSGRDYVRRWVQDVGCAGRRPRAAIADPSFGEWLVERGYVSASQVADLHTWLDGHTRQQIDIRPSVAIERSWALRDVQASDRAGVFTAEVHSAINEFLQAIGDPTLTRSQTVQV